ncbi:P-loop containing nucleoside triphosphate hydrolase protein [Zalerion maritima]|uniref:P-loop containing nucleoside triphosphate hydrolase protein n=1 Tax=Zalerion maritima TaxID=339359 RepID=A0AAD5RN30_9PEZI|nr:P-loop containing nucleoside triphosphate hydrolase protein [Zalerion maritima]
MAPHALGSDKLRQWTRLLPRDGLQDLPLGSKLTDFFQMASELISDDAETSVVQKVVREMATERGLQRVKELTDIRVSTAGDKQLWDRQLHPYLCFLTHPLVLNSSILENEVAALYSHLMGVNGTRISRIVRFIHQLLENAREGEPGILEVSSLVLLKVVAINTTTTINDNIRDSYKLLLGHADASMGLGDGDYFTRKAIAHLQAISRRLETGDALKLPPSQPLLDLGDARASFVLKRDLPGSLSSKGPRHGNDHTDIREISILPPIDEIQSNRAEYRPSLDPSDWHLAGVRGLLDRHVRLIREDTVGQLRDAVRPELELLSGRQDGTSRSGNGMRVWSYREASVVRATFDRRKGFIFAVRCLHPNLPAASQTAASRRRWWEQSKRMQPGALVCLVDPKSVLFCRVHELPLSQFEASGDYSLESSRVYMEVQLQLAEPTTAQVEQEINRLAWATPPKRRSLVEFPGILLDSFKPVLEALKAQYSAMDLPFAPVLAPMPGDKPDSPVEPPLYALRPGFVFDLTPICKPGTSMQYSPLQVPDIAGLCERTTLDESQARALFNSLRRALALTQGPPGTGKSYTGESLIKVLLGNKKKAHLGPVLCVCYTNHALDQLLEHLWRGGTKQIVRIGSRSKSEVLEQVNLRVISSEEAKSNQEYKDYRSAAFGLREMEKDVPDLLGRLHSSGTPEAILEYLKEYHPSIFDLFSGGQDDDGWTQVAPRKDSLLKAWLSSGDSGTSKVRPPEVLRQLQPKRILELSNSERQTLYGQWVRDTIHSNVSQTAEEYSTFEGHIEVIDKVRREVDLRCLRQAQIVGVTTTGLARNIHLLRKLNSKVLLCEEAGEVLEGHLLAALLPSIEHAILIGDHLQLRPQIQNYELQSTNPQGAKHSLDTSLFERLVNPLRDTDPSVPYDTLQIQRRMNPSISRLIRETLYPSLVDAPNVGEYPPVTGMRKRLFWLDHRHPEAGAAGGASLDTSHSNEFEVNMTAALVTHLVRQGVYGRDDIAVLTPYLGQLHKLKMKLSALFEIVLGDRDVADLEKDGLGHEEAEERPLQKNRLNQQLRIATVDNFQGEEAKVVVISLVRSNDQRKCGFLRTSNRINVLLSRAQHGMYVIGNSDTYQHVEMWKAVIDMMTESKEIGTQFELQCARHMDTPLAVSEPDGFLIHSPEGGCILPCEKRLKCGHKCTSRCHSEVLHLAVRCLEPCPRPKKGCEHPCPRKCGDPCEAKCSVILSGQQLILPCGHSISSPTCWQSQYPDLIVCQTVTRKVMPGCSHQLSVPCHDDIADPRYECTAKCGASLDCGHACTRICRACRVKEPDGKLRPAAHQSCLVKCGQCCKPDVKDMVVDMLEFRGYGEIDLDEDPCIFPDCGHIKTLSTLDGLMALPDHYMIGKDGHPSAIKANTEPMSDENSDVKVCPDCRGTLRNLSRYGRMIRRALLWESHKRFICWTNSESNRLSAALQGWEEEYLREESPPAPRMALRQLGNDLDVRGNGGQIIHILKKVVGGRYRSIGEISNQVNRFFQKVREEEQPFQKVYNHVQHARRQNKTSGTFAFDPSVLQSKGEVLALSLQLRCLVSALTDFATMSDKVQWATVTVTANLEIPMKQCQAYIDLAEGRVWPRNQVEGHIIFIRLCVLARKFLVEESTRDELNQPERPVAGGKRGIPHPRTSKEYMEVGSEHIDIAQQLLESNPPCAVFEPELKAAARALVGGTFYQQVTAEEREAIAKVMQQGFQGSGHWYRCVNGHPFTVGECGMPMERARCPDCRGRIGGSNHDPDEGVQRDHAMDALAFAHVPPR